MTSHPTLIRASTILLVVLVAVGAGCGASEDTPQGESASTSETTTPTTAASPIANDDPLESESAFDACWPCEPGTTYLTNTDVPFSFTVVDSDTDWWGVVEDDWSVSMVFANLEGGELEGPQLNVGVAEPGATLESVVAAMSGSAEELDYESSAGLFGGRDVIILEGSLQDLTGPRPRRVLTGEESSIELIFEGGRSYRSHVFEEEGRIFIVSIESSDEMSVVLAEAAPIFESLQIGGA